MLFVSIVILSNERLLNCDALQAFFRPSSERYLLIHFIKYELRDFK